MPDRGQIILGKVFFNKEPVNGRRCAEGGNPVLFQHFQHFMGDKFIIVVYKNSSARNPLPVNLAPGAFGPSGICDRKMKPVVNNILPEFSRNNMAQRIDIVMDNHFGKPCRTRGKIHEHQIFILRCFLSGRAREHIACGFHFFLIRNPAVALCADIDFRLKSRRFGLCLVSVLCHIGIACSNNHLNAGGVIAINQILGT